MTTLHLVRHGQTNWNLERRIQGQTNSILTETGIQQAQQRALELRDVAFTAAYSSSSTRAHDTAKAILQHHDVELSLRDDMREIFLGTWEGKLYKDIEIQQPEHHRNFFTDPSLFTVEGAETFYQVQERALAAIKSIVSLHPEEEVLLVSHGVWIKTILAHIEKRPMQEFWKPPVMDNCCHSIIEFNPDQAKIIQYAGHRQW